MLITVIFWAVWLASGAFAGWRLGTGNGHPAAGIILGAAGGPIGLAAIAAIPATHEARVSSAMQRLRDEQDAASRLGLVPRGRHKQDADDWTYDDIRGAHRRSH